MTTTEMRVIEAEPEYVLSFLIQCINSYLHPQQEILGEDIRKYRDLLITGILLQHIEVKGNKISINGWPEDSKGDDFDKFIVMTFEAIPINDKRCRLIGEYLSFYMAHEKWFYKILETTQHEFNKVSNVSELKQLSRDQTPQADEISLHYNQYPSGRPPNQLYEWARVEIYIKGRDYEEVFKEWRKLGNHNLTGEKDARELFRKAMKRK
jgi:hypothetical protein